MTRKAKYKEEDVYFLSALYHHRPPQLEASHLFFHGKASRSD
jgi:hypothetical protein